MDLTIKQIVDCVFSEQVVAAIETPERQLERLIQSFVKQKCLEQQKIAKDHLFDVGQTVFLTENTLMPFPEI
jgi:hypothetical protein